MSKQYLEPEEFWICPNCEADTANSEDSGEGHVPDEFYYRCDNCGCKYTVKREEVEHGLSGWRLTIDDKGNPKKNVQYRGH